ncbi:MAG: acyl-CoA/acyl-ACP dehydrogenase, partial [bacterium]|nr:acyl-CoA/acyl-ACP dehydrogenase [bacterium]
MDFTPTQEQQMLFDLACRFCEDELIPHELTLEKTGELPRDLELELRDKAIDVGLHACNMPQSAGGPGLGAVEVTLIEKGLNSTSLALAECVRRPSSILAACEGEQVSEYLEPVMAGDKRDCIAMTEPEAGSDLKGMKTKALRDGDDWLISGGKHFISNARISDFVILFAVTGEDQTPKGPRKRISCFLVDLDAPGVQVLPGY